eukprot:g4102.t1
MFTQKTMTMEEHMVEERIRIEFERQKYLRGQHDNDEGIEAETHLEEPSEPEIREDPEVHRTQGTRQPQTIEASETSPPSAHEEQNMGKRTVQSSSTSDTDALGGAPYKLAVVLICYNRDNYLKRALASLYSQLENLPYKRQETIDIFISQDGRHNGVTAVINDFRQDVKSKIGTHLHTNHFLHDQSGGPTGYHKLADHFHYALDRVFNEFAHEHVIILEDDLDLAPDFFSYFYAMIPVLDFDPTIYCISAYNDNGLSKFVDDPTRLFRTNIFPGLGWMLGKDLWNEIASGWPDAYWDEYMRAPRVRQGRVCIRPEISRTKTFGETGTSNGEFFHNFLATIRLNDIPIDFERIDYEYINKNIYEQQLRDDIAVATWIKVSELNSLSTYTPEENSYEIVNGQRKKDTAPRYKIEYRSFVEFGDLAATIGIHNSIKEGHPRAGYNGVVHIRYQGNVLYLVPGDNMKFS